MASSLRSSFPAASNSATTRVPIRVPIRVQRPSRVQAAKRFQQVVLDGYQRGMAFPRMPLRRT